jgi:hypothetical protein
MEPSSRNVPERPSHLRSRFELSGSRLTIAYRRIDPTGCFLLLWLTGWTVGCVMLLGMVIQQPAVTSLMFAIPFWASWIFVFCLVMNSFFRKELLELGPEGIQFVCRVIVPIMRRIVPLEEVEGFGSYLKVTDSESNTLAKGIEVRTRGHGFRFGQGLPDAERAWLIDQLNEQLDRLAPDQARPMVGSGSAHDTDGEADDLGKIDDRPERADAESSERLVAAATPIAPPSDSRWTRLDDFHQITFVTRGRAGCGAIGMLLFINAFWNGIVGVFVTQLLGAPMFGDGGGLKGAEWWFLFVFLIPFEVIGLVMFVGLLVTVVEPFRRTRWSFAYGGAEKQTTWFGIGRSRSYPVDWLDRIELRIGSRERTFFRSTNDSDTPAPPARCLVFIDRENQERFTIDGLTQGDARWIADTILRECQRWFR